MANSRSGRHRRVELFCHKAFLEMGLDELDVTTRTRCRRRRGRSLYLVRRPMKTRPVREGAARPWSGVGPRSLYRPFPAFGKSVRQVMSEEGREVAVEMGSGIGIVYSLNIEAVTTRRHRLREPVAPFR